MKRLKKHIFNNAEKKENIIIALLIVILVWLAVLSWVIFLQDKNIKLHEFYLKEILQKI
jgi:hypothetical protein